MGGEARHTGLARPKQRQGWGRNSSIAVEPEGPWGRAVANASQRVRVTSAVSDFAQLVR